MASTGFTTAQRRGMTLVEMVVVIGVQSILLATAVGLIARLLLTEQAGRQDLQAVMSFQALAEQFRLDVNAAHEVATPEQTATAIDLHLPANRRATYEIHEGRVERIERRENLIVRREAYRLPRAWTVSFEDVSEEPRRSVRMMVTHAKAPRLGCEAVLGLDWDVAMSTEGADDGL